MLAGFLVQLYVGLQPSDNQDTNNLLAQNTLELRQISRQLANSNYVPVDIPLPSPIFQASTSLVWINTLWFLSLVLSLASALFGMISKQWLREYLQWTTMSGLSENQVALRQNRYEAFKDWNAPAIIASMPVLLEIALILFLLGMEILLWTLNTVVFGVCTVAVIAIIVLVIVVTVLPVFRARCPYKSPMGWAVILFKRALVSLWNRFFDLLERLSGCLGSNSFRAWDHQFTAESDPDWRAWDVSRQRWSHYDHYFPTYLNITALGLHRMQARALLWIAGTSQDQRLLRAVEESVAGRTLPKDWTRHYRLVVDFYIACEYLGINPSQLVPCEDECISVHAAEGSRIINISSIDYRSLEFLLLRLTAQEQRLKSAMTNPNNISLRTMQYRLGLRQINGQWQEDMLFVDVPPSVCGWIGHMLACDLLAAVVQYCNERNTFVFKKQDGYILQAALALIGLCVRRAVAEERRPCVAVNRLSELFNFFCHNYETLPPQHEPLLPLLATFLDALENHLFSPQPLPSIGDFERTRLALIVPSTTHRPPSTWSEADCSRFATLAQFALREWHAEHDLSVTRMLLPQLLDRMTACVLRCLNQRWENCAMSASRFSWTTRLRELFDPRYPTKTPLGRHLPPDIFPHSLVNALKQFNDAGLIAVSDMRAFEQFMYPLVRRSESLNQQRIAVSIDKVGDISDPGLENSDTLSGQARPQSTSSHRSFVECEPLARMEDVSSHLSTAGDAPNDVLHHSSLGMRRMASQLEDTDDTPANLSTQTGAATTRHSLDESIALFTTEALSGALVAHTLLPTSIPLLQPLNETIVLEQDREEHTAASLAEDVEPEAILVSSPVLKTADATVHDQSAEGFDEPTDGEGVTSVSSAPVA